ncbi:MAG: glycosyltransferase family 1 protein, partial [Candidatus Omnitrophota bacterium]|nr:glycosyltransferase family 1 protein [Candidatus Omnitrophota bacterium]
YSGNTDFMSINNSYLVRYKLVKIDRDHGPYQKGKIWAEPDIDHAAEIMRFVYENRKLANKAGSIASEDIRRNLNYAVIGKEISNRLENIYEKCISF